MTNNASQPKYRHVCPTCFFLGSFQSRSRGLCDLYACNRTGETRLMIRFSDEPEDVIDSHSSYDLVKDHDFVAFGLAVCFGMMDTGAFPYSRRNPHLNYPYIAELLMTGRAAIVETIYPGVGNVTPHVRLLDAGPRGEPLPGSYHQPSTVRPRMENECLVENFELVDAVKGGAVTGWLHIDPSGISIHFDGYGDNGTQEFASVPLFVEFYEGKLRVCVSEDINDGNPTIISLEGALESKRIEKDDEETPAA